MSLTGSRQEGMESNGWETAEVDVQDHAGVDGYMYYKKGVGNVVFTREWGTEAC